VYVPRNPAFNPSAPKPLVVMFHGTGGDGERFYQISGWRQKAEQEGIVVVFPTGVRYRILESGRLKTKWHSFNLPDLVDLNERPDGYPLNAPWPANDVGFLRRIVADVEQGWPINPRRRYLTGFSNGAEFAARASVNLSATFAAAAWVAGGLDRVRDPARNMPVMIEIGALDDRVLAQVNAADPPPDPPVTRLPLDPARLLALEVIDAFIDTHVRTYDLRRGLPNVAIRFANRTILRWRTPRPGNNDHNLVDVRVLAGIGHRYPNGNNNPHGHSAPDVFWRFFEAHPARS
jgi:polyhydroxybutyrate depolymerase